MSPLGPRTTIEKADAGKLVEVIGPLLPGLLAEPRGLPTTDKSPKSVIFDGSDVVVNFVAQENGRDLAMGGPLTPDQIVYCRSFPLWFTTRTAEPEIELTERLGAAMRTYATDQHMTPGIVLVQGLGLFACGGTWAEANTARLVYIDAIKLMTGALGLGSIHYLDTDFQMFIEQWEVESYRRARWGAVACPDGRVR